MKRMLLAALTALALLFAAGDSSAAIGKPKKKTPAKKSPIKKVGGAKAGLKQPKAHTVTVSKSKHPESAKHIADAQKNGKPKTLTINRPGAKKNRRASLKGIKTKTGKDRDEYPPAMFKEGGKKASVRHIGSSDNRGAGSCIGAQCRKLKDGDKVEIKVGK